jgi:hypothetical protein
MINQYQKGEYSVTQFFSKTQYETVRNHVSVEEAVKAFNFYTSNVAANVGLTIRVIITDGGDCINYEWQYGKGIVFGDN